MLASSFPLSQLLGCEVNRLKIKWGKGVTELLLNGDLINFGVVAGFRIFAKKCQFLILQSFFQISYVWYFGRFCIDV